MAHRFFLILFYLLFYCSSSFAGFEITANIEPKSGDANTIFRFEVSVNVKGSETIESPQIGSSSEFIIESRGKRQSMTIRNGDPSQSVSFIFQVQAKRQLAPGEYLLPKSQVEIDGKFYQIEQLSIRIEAAPKVSRKGPLDFIQIVDNFAPYEGEQVTYRSELVSGAEISDAVLEETTLPSFFREDFPEHKQVVRRVSNSRVFSVREAIYPNKTGELEIPERGLSAKVKVQADSRRQWGEFFDDLWTDVFDEFNFKPIRVVAPSLKLNVRPLPLKPAGVSGYTPVGTTTVKSRLDKAELRAGESGILEILVESEGNLKPLEFDFSKILPSNFRSYPERPESENILNGERVIQRKLFQAAIIPEYGGQFEVMEPVVYFFDPKSESYQKALGEKLTLIVAGPAPAKKAELGVNLSSEKTEILPEPILENEPQLPSRALRIVGVSRRWFSVFLAVILITALMKFWSKMPPSTIPVKRDFNKILAQLRASQWALSGSLREELKASRPSDFENIIALIDRVNFSTPALRAQAISELENFLKDIK